LRPDTQIISCRAQLRSLSTLTHHGVDFKTLQVGGNTKLAVVYDIEALHVHVFTETYNRGRLIGSGLHYCLLKESLPLLVDMGITESPKLSSDISCSCFPGVYDALILDLAMSPTLTYR
jgi:hypothetical protein